MALFNSPAHQWVVVSLLKNNMQVNGTDIINFLTIKVPASKLLRSLFARVRIVVCKLLIGAQLVMYHYHVVCISIITHSREARVPLGELDSRKRVVTELLGDFDYEGKVR